MFCLILNSVFCQLEIESCRKKVQLDVLLRDKKFNRDFFHISAIVQMLMQIVLNGCERGVYINESRSYNLR